MKWKKLTALGGDVIWEGAIIRAYPSYLDEYTDFMVFSSNESGYGLGLIYVTGYHAGKIYVLFPTDSLPKDAKALSCEWLVKNWEKYVDEKGDIGKVYVTDRYPNPEMNIEICM